MIELTVYGEPAAQGSKRHVGNGVMVEQSKKVKPWREAVKWAFTESNAMTRPVIFGPVAVDAVFTMKRPKSAKPGARPAKAPDIDKILRSTFDALTQVGAWEDDSRVVSVFATKLYTGDIGALRTPGAYLRVRPAPALPMRGQAE